LTPVLDQLNQKGIVAEFRSMLSDPLEDGAGHVNVWLATEFGEAPPIAGYNILWFLTQMKLVPHSVLLAYDAIFTASLDHLRFLQAWIGHVRQVAELGWPLPTIEMPPPAPRKKLIGIDYSGISEHPAALRQSRLPAMAQDLANLLGQYETITTNQILRERMCGFYGFEEVVAVLAGCRIRSEERQGLAPEIAPFFLGHEQPQINTDSAQQLQALEAFRKRHDYSVVAQKLFDVAQQIIAEKPKDSGEFKTGEIPLSLPKDAPISEVDAFYRDRDAVLALWRDIEPFLNHSESTNVSLSAPWNSAISHRDLADMVPTPWTSLSLTRAIVQLIHTRQYQPTSEDCNRLRQIYDILQRFDPRLTKRALPLEDWPTVPWTRVAEECQEPKRDYVALSRAVNGHNIYRFSQSTVFKKALSPYILDGHINPAEFLSKTAIFMHAFYIDVAQETIQNIRGHLSGCPIFVTTDTEEKRGQLLKILRQENWSNHRVDVVQNIGRDVYPKLLHMAPDHANFEFVLHLHSKKSPHSSSLAKWGTETVGVLAGDADILGQIANAFQSDPRLGIIYADPPAGLHPAMSWTRNLRLSEMLATALDIHSLPTGEDVDFPVGSMFWARRDALHMMQQGQIGPQHFVKEDAQEDGTLAHAIERMLGVACLARGYHMARRGAKNV
jgi:hypothetical protein